MTQSLNSRDYLVPEAFIIRNWPNIGKLPIKRFQIFWRFIICAYHDHLGSKIDPKKVEKAKISSSWSKIQEMNNEHYSLYDIHINRRHFLRRIQKNVLQGHLRSYKGHQKVKSWILIIISALYIYFDPKFDREVKFGVKLNRFRCQKVISGHFRVKSRSNRVYLP